MITLIYKIDYFLSEKITLPPIPQILGWITAIKGSREIWLDTHTKKTTGHALSPQDSVADDLVHYVNYIIPVIGG